MGYFPVRYDSRVVIYDCRGFIRLATDHQTNVWAVQNCLTGKNSQIWTPIQSEYVGKLCYLKGAKLVPYIMNQHLDTS